MHKFTTATKLTKEAQRALQKDEVDPHLVPVKSKRSSSQQDHSSSSSCSPASSPPTSPEHGTTRPSKGARLYTARPEFASTCSLASTLGYTQAAGPSNSTTAVPFLPVKFFKSLRHGYKDRPEKVVREELKVDVEHQAELWGDVVLREVLDVGQRAGEMWEKETLPLLSKAYAPATQHKTFSHPLQCTASSSKESSLQSNDHGMPWFSPKPGREQVLKVSHMASPTHETSDKFVILAKRTNEEYVRRAICSDDWTVNVPQIPTRAHTFEERMVQLPVYIALERFLPNPAIFATEERPGVFTSTTYRSTAHKIVSVEKGSVDPDLGYRDEVLQARVNQYHENKVVLSSTMKKGKFSRTGSLASSRRYGDLEKLSTQGQGAVKALLKDYGDMAEGDNASPAEHMQLVMLRSWELKRDIERLKAVQRNVIEARKRMTELPQISAYSIRRTREWRDVPDPNDDDYEARIMVRNMMEKAIKDALKNRPQAAEDGRRLKTSFNEMAKVYEMSPTTRKTLTDASSGDQPFHYDDDAEWERTKDLQRSSSVYSDCQSLSDQETSHAQRILAQAQEALRDHQTRYLGSSPLPAIVQRPARTEGEGDEEEGIMKAGGRLLVDRKDSSNALNVQEELRQEGVDPSDYGRYPKIQNIVQQ
ncbi:hypothetical protein BKA66DRAFT_612722 [Pyrenochaeta sp. MPI-SDFR-AT-0127]|nr:hypothetical protein BKA66DRAFT_612722 [Pyrenochaeta sp. MPI-SDFR-AT-0127]